MNMHRQIALMMQPAAGEPPVVTDPVFWANTYDPVTFEMLGVKTGVGGLTEARAYEIDVPDDQGVYVAVPGGQPAWEGARWDAGVAYADNGSGVLLDPVPRLVYAPQATNELLYSRDLTSRAGSEYTWTTTGSLVITVDQIGLRGDANGASLLTKDTTPNTYTEIITVLGSSGRDFVVKLYFRQEAMDGDYAGIKIALGDTGGDRRIYAINKETGAHSVISEVNNPFTYEHSEIVGNEVVFTVGGNALATTKVYIAIYGAVSKDFATVDTSALGNITVMNVEVYMDATADVVKDFPPLINDTAATVTRDACALSYDSVNHDDAEGTYLIEIEHGADGQMLLSEFLRIIGVSMRLTDGVNLADVASAAGAHKVGITYGGGSMQLTIDGVKSGVASYNGTLLVGALDLFRGSPNVGYVGSIRRYDESSESIVNAWMAE